MFNPMAKILPDMILESKSVKGGWNRNDEGVEFAKKFENCFVGYDGLPALIFANDFSTDNPKINCKIYSPEIKSFVAKSLSLYDPKFDFSVVPPMFVNTKSYLMRLTRPSHKQWKWGISDKNVKICKIGLHDLKDKLMWGEQHPVTSVSHIVSIYTNNFPKLSELVSSGKVNKRVERGVALTKDVVVIKRPEDDKLLFFIGMSKGLVAFSSVSKPNKVEMTEGNAEFEQQIMEAIKYGGNIG